MGPGMELLVSKGDQGDQGDQGKNAVKSKSCIFTLFLPISVQFMRV